MNTLRTWLATGLAAAALTLATAARADIPPPDGCTTKDAACNNAPGNQPGTCLDAQCVRSTPDGPVTYDCLRCKANGGAGGTSGTGGVNTTGAISGTGAADSGGSSNSGGKAASGSAGAPKADSDGGCALGRLGGGEGGLAALMVALGLGALLVSRRRN